MCDDGADAAESAPKNEFLYRMRCAPCGKSYAAVAAEIRREFDRAVAAISGASVIGEEDAVAVVSGLRVLRRLARVLIEHSDQSEFGGAINDAIYLNQTYTTGSHGNVTRQLRIVLQFSLEDFI